MLIQLSRDQMYFELINKIKKLGLVLTYLDSTVIIEKP